MASETIKAATDEAIEGLRQAYLKGYHRAALCWFANGGYSSGPDDDPSRFVSFASVLARFDADRQLIEQLVMALDKLEWSKPDYEEGGINHGPGCPSCGGHKYGSGYAHHEPGGHRKNCKLSAALQKARAAGKERG